MHRTVTQNDSLPPVEPPSAAFLVQLFLVPAVIVAIIVCVWLAFHWLAHLGSDPQAYIRTLRRNNEGRWQAALNLANELRSPGSPMKTDEPLADALASVLADEVASGRTGEQSQTLRMYLCRALGEFAIPAALPPLVEQAGRTSDPQTARAAVEALAVLWTSLDGAARQAADASALVGAVETASRGDDAGLRGAAAFTLGVVGGDAAVERLVQLAADETDDVRYNAALGLARLGREESLDALGEMLALDDLPSTAGDPTAMEQSQRYKRALVVVNALRGVAALVDATGAAPPGAVTDRIDALQQDPVADVRTSAAALLKKIERLAAPAVGT